MSASAAVFAIQVSIATENGMAISIECNQTCGEFGHSFVPQLTPTLSIATQN